MEQLDYNEYNELFAYGPETGELINRADRGKRAKKGESALSKSRQGKFQVRVGNRAIPAERVCLLLLNGEDHGTDIVFLDGDCLNLRADNLKVDDDTKVEGKTLTGAKIKPEPVIEDPPAQVNGEVVRLKNGRWLAKRLNGLCIEVVGRFETKRAALESLR